MFRAIVVAIIICFPVCFALCCAIDMIADHQINIATNLIFATASVLVASGASIIEMRTKSE